MPKLLGNAFSGIINCDRAKMYWQAARLQWCWAHLKRDIQALIDHPDKQVKRLGHDLMRQVKLMFQHWKRYKAGKISWNTFRAYMRPVRKEINGLLLRGKLSGNKRLVGMCKELYGHREWLWTFVDTQGIEPTNNAGERALQFMRKPAIQYFSRFMERFGMVPVTLPWEDVEVAVQTGELDGIAWSGITEDYTVGWADVTNYFLTNNISGAWIGHFFANMDRWNELPPHLQELVTGVAEQLGCRVVDVDDAPVLPQPVGGVGMLATEPDRCPVGSCPSSDFWGDRCF